MHRNRHVLVGSTVCGIGENATHEFNPTGRATQNLEVLIGVSVLKVLRLLIVLLVLKIDDDVTCLVCHRQKEEFSAVWVDDGLLVTARRVFVRAHRSYRLL